MKYFTKIATTVEEVDMKASLPLRVVTYPGRLISRGLLLNKNMGKIKPENIKINIEDIKKHTKKHLPKDTDILIENGNVSISNAWDRAKNKKGAINSKALAALVALNQKFTPNSSYNPFSNTINLKDNVRSISAHELGHAIDYNNRKHPFLYMVGNSLLFNLPHEFKANENAMKLMTKKDLPEINKTLTPALGSYLGDVLPTPIGPFAGIAGGHIVGRKIKPFKKKDLKKESN